MGEFQRMSPAEKEVMAIVWAADSPLTSAQVVKELDGLHHWRPTTVQTFLARLVEKGLLVATKQGKANTYQAALSAAAYGKEEAKAFLFQSHGGSLKNFVATLYDDSGISQSDLDELRLWLDQRK